MSLRSVTLILAFLTGYLTLSLEMIWIRIIDFARHGLPETFGFVLSAFLLGIALGAYIAGRLSLNRSGDVFRSVSYLLIAATFLSFFSIPVVVETFTVSYQVGLAMSFLFITLVACAYGAIFPMLCHAAIGSTESVGRKISYIYLANILGATLGPLLTGLYLFNHVSLPTIVLGIAVLSALASVALYTGSVASGSRKLIYAVSLIVLSAVAFQTQGTLYQDIYAKLQYNTGWSKKGPFKHVVENRSGLITVEQAKYGGDPIYGGGVWDGRFNIDPVFDLNGISRAYFVAALHRKPTEVLEIGLSSASWALVLDSYELIESLDVVEINRGYPEVIRHYPEQSRLFESDKTRIHFDDGRRWLTRNPARKFDLIVMNTSFHGRSNITNLLSQEFLEIMKSHLKPGGVAYYNTTYSEDVIFTAAHVYRYVLQYQNFIAVSDVPFDMSRQEIRENLRKFTKGPMAAMHQSKIHKPVFGNLVATDLVDISKAYRNRYGLVKITDDNMATEFPRQSPAAGVPWAAFLVKIWR
ncbi:MAG: hypothetical protein ACERLB_08100 [Gammaproteobacteria bacterium]